MGVTTPVAQRMKRNMARTIHTWRWRQEQQCSGILVLCLAISSDTLQLFQ